MIEIEFLVQNLGARILLAAEFSAFTLDIQMRIS
jgi:hypothetical protein